jgi:hypothetical protein
MHPTPYRRIFLALIAGTHRHKKPLTSAGEHRRTDFDQGCAAEVGFTRFAAVKNPCQSKTRLL